MKHIIRRALLALVLISGFSPAIAQVPAAVPALPDTERRTSYTISASTCACAVNFALFGDGTDYQNWVEVFINGTRVNYNDATYGWTITSPSGSLTGLARPITNAVLTFNAVQTGTVQIVGARRPRRTSQFNENAGVPTRNFNQVLTDIISQNREIWDKTNDVTGRAIMAPPGEALNILASAATRASTALGFDAFGQIALYSPGSGVTTSANVTFLQYGTGATSRTTQAKMREWFSVLDFATAGGGNCIQDQITDCAAAINAAAAAVVAYSQAGGNAYFNSNGTIWIPPGKCFRIASPIILPKNVSIRGAGGISSCILADNTNAVSLSYVSGGGISSIEGVFFYGTGATAPRTAIAQTDVTNEGNTITGFTLRDVSVYQFDTGIHYNTMIHPVIDHFSATAVNNCIDFHGQVLNPTIIMTNCSFTPGALPTPSAGYGLNLQPYTYTATAHTFPPEGVSVIKSQLFGFQTPIDILGAAYVTVNQSNLVGKLYGIRYTQLTDDFTFTNNNVEIQSATAVAGIYAKGCTTPGCMSSKVSSLIHGNIIQSSSGAVSAKGIQVNAPGESYNDNIIIQGNLITAMQSGDIEVNNPGNVKVIGNSNLSTVPTNSILISGAIRNGNVVAENWSQKAHSYTVAADITSGTTRYYGNTISGGVLEAASWNVETSGLTGNRLIVGQGAGFQPVPFAAGTNTTVIHGNAGGLPFFGAVVSADLNITATACTAQFVSAISAAAAGTCTSPILTSAQFANQGTATTLLHGNASGNLSFGQVSLTSDVAAILPVANGGTGAAVVSAVLNAAPANPTGSASLTSVMMGLGTTCVITTTTRTRVRFVITGMLTNNTAGDGSKYQLSYGTGVAPANAAVASGTVFGSGAVTFNATSGGLASGPFTATGIATGLSASTAYWFDIQLGAVTGGTASIQSLGCSAEEL